MRVRDFPNLLLRKIKIYDRKEESETVAGVGDTHMLRFLGDFAEKGLRDGEK